MFDEVDVEDEFSESHYMKQHWARATTKTPVRIRDLKEQVVALINHGSEINLMSMDFYKKEKWPINTKHMWKVRAATRAMEELHEACLNVRVRTNTSLCKRHPLFRTSSANPTSQRLK